MTAEVAHVALLLNKNIYQPFSAMKGNGGSSARSTKDFESLGSRVRIRSEATISFLTGRKTSPQAKII